VRHFTEAKCPKLNLHAENIFVNLYPNEYRPIGMYFIQKTAEFDKWFRKLNDLRAKAKILFRLQKLENEEHFGEYKPVGNGISELKIDYAKGYRIYFKETDGKLIILLIGGDKSTQQKDIEKAKVIWDKLKK
jgi:putative addiction module killer protein